MTSKYTYWKLKHYCLPFVENNEYVPTQEGFKAVISIVMLGNISLLMPKLA